MRPSTVLSLVSKVCARTHRQREWYVPRALTAPHAMPSIPRVLMAQRWLCQSMQMVAPWHIVTVAAQSRLLPVQWVSVWLICTQTLRGPYEANIVCPGSDPYTNGEASWPLSMRWRRNV